MMFAVKDKEQQQKVFASSSKSLDGQTSRVPQVREPLTFHTLQRNLGNSYLQAFSQMAIKSDRLHIQRASACGNSCANCTTREKDLQMLQPKLVIGSPDDVYEQEANRFAEQVMQMPEPTLQKQIKPEEEEVIQPKTIADQAGSLNQKHYESAAPSIVREVLNSPGQPLDTDLRRFMEPKFGYDFRQVRVHTDGRAAASAHAVNALAYTVGNDLVFAEGQYAPESTAGRRLLAHELTHVVQQGGNNTVIQRMLACPSRLADTDATPPGWQSYHGDSSWFHCGFRGILEERIPTPSNPQNECFYDHSGTLVDENHPYAGCRGTPNQYDSARNPFDHTFSDSGGIWNAGKPAFITSRVYTLSRPIAAAVQIVTTSANIIRSVVGGFGSAIALAILTAEASVDPGNWSFQGLPSRSVRHLNVMGAIIGSAALSQNVDTLLRNLTRRLDSFPITALLDEIAQDINQALQNRGVTTQQVTSSDLGVLSLIQLVEWLRVQGIMQYLRSPEDIANEQLTVQQAATP